MGKQKIIYKISLHYIEVQYINYTLHKFQLEISISKGELKLGKNIFPPYCRTPQLEYILFYHEEIIKIKIFQLLVVASVLSKVFCSIVFFLALRFSRAVCSWVVRLDVG